MDRKENEHINLRKCCSNQYQQSRNDCLEEMICIWSTDQRTIFQSCKQQMLFMELDWSNARIGFDLLAYPVLHN